MSLIRRRKSPGWSKTPTKRTISRVIKVPKVGKTPRKSSSKLKTTKIVNPISGKKINLNGPTHKRLIRDGILDSSGVDTRSKKSKTPTPKTKTQKPSRKAKALRDDAARRRLEILNFKPGPGDSRLKNRLQEQLRFAEEEKVRTEFMDEDKPSRLYGDVLGGVMRFLPEKEMVKVSKVTKKPRQSLLSYPFDLSKEKVCQAFSNSDFNVLMKNQNLDRQGLFECVVRRGLADKVKILLKDSKVDPRMDKNYAIRVASELGHLRVVKELMDDERVYPGDKDGEAIQIASQNGHALVVRELLKDPRVNPSFHNNYAIRVASANGHLGVVKELLKDSRVDPSVNNNYAIRKASKNGHTSVVRELLKDSRVDPSDKNNEAIEEASDAGYLATVRELLKDKRVDPGGLDNWAIRLASKNGHLGVVRELLKDKRVNPSDGRNDAIVMASKNGHQGVVRELLKDKRVNQMVAMMRL